MTRTTTLITWPQSFLRDLYQQFYAFCKTNNWSKSTAIKFAIHQLFSSES